MYVCMYVIPNLKPGADIREGMFGRHAIRRRWQAATLIAVSSTALRRQRTDLTDLSDLIYFLFTRPLSGFKLAFSLLLFCNNRFRLTSASARKRHAESCMRVIA